jgi:hypothetical protein
MGQSIFWTPFYMSNILSSKIFDSFNTPSPSLLSWNFPCQRRYRNFYDYCILLLLFRSIRWSSSSPLRAQITEHGTGVVKEKKLD